MALRAMTSFRLLACAVLAAATMPRLLHRGMFVDGAIYASIARNLAEDRGRFWAPSYTATVYPEYYDHPPLGFWLQSLWFRVLGDYLFVERVYSMAAAIVVGLLVSLIWRQLHERGSRERQYEWLPVLILMSIPVVSWSIVGNLLETTVAVLTTGAVAASLHAGVARTTPGSIGWGVLSGLCVVAAFLTKGPVGLFPLAGPLVLAPLASTSSRRWASLASQWTTVVVCAFALVVPDASRVSLTRYVNEQVLAAIAGRREVSDSSLTILEELVQGVGLPVAIVATLIVAVARRFVAPPREQRRWATLLLLLWLAGTLPILVSAKQAGYYLVPAVPLCALGVAGLLAATTRAALENVGPRAGRVAVTLAAIVILGAVGASFSPALDRDRRRLADLDALDLEVPRNAIVGICPESQDDWGLHALFARRFRVSLDAGRGRERAWFLETSPAIGRCRAPERCRPVTSVSRDLVLLECGRGGPR